MVKNKTNIKIFITGGMGKLGKVLVDSLIQHGYCNLTILSRKSVPNSKLDFVCGDINDLDKQCVDHIKNSDIVIHLAANLSMWGKDNYVTNVSGTKKLIKNINKKLVKFIFVSSIEAFRPITDYGKSKLMAENMVTDYFDSRKLNWTIFRVGNIRFDSNDYIENKMKKLAQSRDNIFDKIVYRWWGKSEMNYVNVDSVCDKILESIEGKFNNKLQYLVGERVSIEKFSRKIINQNLFDKLFFDLIIFILGKIKRGGWLYYLGMRGSRNLERKYENL